MTLILSAIAAGHADLADLLFLLAAILLTVCAVVELLGRSIVVGTRTIGVIAIALIAWAWFVL